MTSLESCETAIHDPIHHTGLKYDDEIKIDSLDYFIAIISSRTYAKIKPKIKRIAPKKGHITIYVF